MSREARQEKVPGEFVDGLAHGLAVLAAFDEEHAQMTLSEVARRTNLTAATARRSLKTLEALGYVRSADKRFVLAARVLTLGVAYSRTAHIEDTILPELKRIVGLFGDVSSVSILDDFNVLYVASYSDQPALRTLSSPGITYPAFATSGGRVLLAARPANELAAYFATADLRKFTDATEVRPVALAKILKAARHDGYAVTSDQLLYGNTALAVPIHVNGRVVAALNTAAYGLRAAFDELITIRLHELRLSASRLAAVLMRHPALLQSLNGAGTGDLEGKAS